MVYENNELYVYNHYNRAIFFNLKRDIFNRYIYKSISKNSIQLTVDININLNPDTFVKIVKFIIPLIKYNYDF